MKDFSSISPRRISMGLSHKRTRTNLRVLDDFSPYFFQQHWDIVGESISNFCLDALNNDASLACVDHTPIALLFRIPNPRKISESISLHNLVYKISMKGLAYRLKQLLADIIYECRSAFVPESLITDNAIVGFKCMHRLMSLNLGSMGYIALKLDMSKASNRVEWGFIRETVLKLGFNNS